eukprot:364165-Chlamydomonas_euryale.AAC.10
MQTSAALRLCCRTQLPIGPPVALTVLWGCGCHFAGRMRCRDVGWRGLRDLSRAEVEVVLQPMAERQCA